MSKSLWLTRQRKTPAKRQSMTRGGLFADTNCPYSAGRVRSWTYLWVADAKPSATQYHPVGVVLIMQSPRWLTTDLLCSYFDRESSCQYRWRDRRHLGAVHQGRHQALPAQPQPQPRRGRRSQRGHRPRRRAARRASPSRLIRPWCERSNGSSGPPRFPPRRRRPASRGYVAGGFCRSAAASAALIMRSAGLRDAV